MPNTPARELPAKRITGWLFDLDELGSDLILWVYDFNGRLYRLVDEFLPPVYVEGSYSLVQMLGRELQTRNLITRFQWVKRRDFWSGRLKDVLEILVSDSSLLPKLRTLAASRDRDFVFYNIDLPATQYYLYSKRLFPLCKLEVAFNNDYRVLEVRSLDSLFDHDLSGVESRSVVDRLRVMDMRGDRIEPLSGKSRIILSCNDESISINLNNVHRATFNFNDFIERHDPDIILSERGDGLLFPTLFRLTQSLKLQLCADRDDVISKRTVITEGRTFYSYGKVIYKGPAYPLRGRWHLDKVNSFFHKETGLEGVLELARLARIPVQRMARQSPGTAMTSVQMALAIEEGILIPWRKSQPEKYKSAMQLLTIDKGGLTFMPKVGAHENVIELDFSSMYPTMMARENISPETILCECCRNERVPEAQYTICEKRKGLLPRVLEPLIERRSFYKKEMQKTSDAAYQARCDARQAAIKWTLVSCFGYLGYRNARFGRIEAHEATTAFGREKLLHAKELAEARGFRLLHALTDSLWLKREGATKDEIIELCEEISRATNVELALEGWYRWVIFLPSKTKATKPVATRYYGLFDDGRLKIRGLACRRSDTPPFIAESQRQALDILARAQNLHERLALSIEVETLLQRKIEEVRCGKVPIEELAIKKRLTKHLDSYKTKTRTAEAARQLLEARINVHPGEKVRYVLTGAKRKSSSKSVAATGIDQLTGYDASSYIEMLRQCIQELAL